MSPNNGTKGQRTSRRGARGTNHLTCANCRTRKIKCDGNQPECHVCLAYGERCHFDKTPPMSQVLAMARRIEELEQALANATTDVGQTLQGQTPFTVEHTIPAISPDAVRSLPGHDHIVTQSPMFESTSAVQDPIEMPSATTGVHAALPSPHTQAMTQEQLDAWELAALDSCAASLRLPREKVAHLLQTYWTWVYPSFMFLAKASFLRDAATGGTFFSQLLLCVLCLQATRFTDHGLSAELQSQVHLLLGQQLPREPTIPTAQALLQLSAREIGRGSLHRAWLYSGMAFRMTVDMGAYSRACTATVDAETRNVSQQLAWSCYLWDKAVSLYLGRAPTLPEAPCFETPAMEDLSETGVWWPYVCDGQDVVSSPGSVRRLHASSCFRSFGSLAPIITDVLLTIYAKKSVEDASSFIPSTLQRLEQWKSSLPGHLVIDEQSSESPAVHILTQNMLYQTTIILLCRPGQRDTHLRAKCRASAAEIERLLLMLDKSFGLSHTTYLMAYCAYIAATIALIDLQDHIDGSIQRLNICLRALYGIRASCPGIQRSIDIIVKNMEKKSKASTTTSTGANVAGPSAPAVSLPAFPLDTYDGSGFPDMMSFDDLPFGGLDPFVQDWSTLSTTGFDDMSI